MMSRQAVLQVLERAGRDIRFIGQLTDETSRTLREYDLTLEEAGALMSGDIRWLERYLGKLNGVLSAWPNCRLQQEHY